MCHVDCVSGVSAHSGEQVQRRPRQEVCGRPSYPPAEGVSVHRQAEVLHLPEEGLQPRDQPALRPRHLRGLPGCPESEVHRRPETNSHSGVSVHQEGLLLPPSRDGVQVSARVSLSGHHRDQVRGPARTPSVLQGANTAV